MAKYLIHFTRRFIEATIAYTSQKYVSQRSTTNVAEIENEDKPNDEQMMRRGSRTSTIFEIICVELDAQLPCKFRNLRSSLPEAHLSSRIAVCSSW